MPIHRFRSQAPIIHRELTYSSPVTAWAYSEHADDFKVEAANGNLTLLEPTGTVPGDLLVACISYRSNAAFTATGSRWTKIAESNTGNTTVGATGSIASGVMFYSIRGADPPSYLFTRTAGDLGMGCVMRYQGQHPDQPYAGLVSANVSATNQTTFTTGTMTTPLNNMLLVSMAAGGRNAAISAMVSATGATTGSGAASTTDVNPASNTWQQRLNFGTATGADGRLETFDAIQATAGATGTMQCSMLSACSGVLIVAAFKLWVPGT